MLRLKSFGKVGEKPQPRIGRDETPLRLESFCQDWERFAVKIRALSLRLEAKRAPTEVRILLPRRERYSRLSPEKERGTFPPRWESLCRDISFTEPGHDVMVRLPLYSPTSTVYLTWLESKCWLVAYIMPNANPATLSKRRFAEQEG